MHLFPNSYGVTLREFNPCHSPKDGRFSAKGDGNCSGTPSSAGKSSAPPSTAGVEALRSGSISSSEPLGGGVNTTLVVTMGDGSKAVYKPETGERWMESGWANDDISRYIMPDPEFSQALREAAAYEVDRLLGTNLVPETVHRETVDVEVEHGGGGGYDRDELSQMYRSWREGQLDGALEQVGDKLFPRYQEDKDEFLQDLNNLMEKDGGIADVWNEVVDENPDVAANDLWNKYGEDIDEHPVLRSKDAGEATIGFNPKKIRKVMDPLDALEEAGIDVTEIAGPDHYPQFDKDQRAALKDVLQRAMAEDGYTHLGDFDTDKAGEKFQEYGEWVEQHADTEARLLDEAVASYSQWKADNGYTENGFGEALNPNAPNPNGGSLQRLVPNATGWGTISEADGTRFAILDYALGSMDRHGGNYIFDGNDNPYAIDNGMSFPNYFGSDITFRSTPVRDWRNSDEDETIKATVLTNLRNTDWDGWLARQPSMSQGSKDAFKQRLSMLEMALSEEGALNRLWRNTSLMR